jgi:hypothetical protein
MVERWVTNVSRTTLFSSPGIHFPQDANRNGYRNVGSPLRLTNWRAATPRRFYSMEMWFHKRRIIFWAAEGLSTFQEGHCPIDSVKQLVFGTTAQTKSRGKRSHTKKLTVAVSSCEALFVKRINCFRTNNTQAQKSNSATPYWAPYATLVSARRSGNSDSLRTKAH